MLSAPPASVVAVCARPPVFAAPHPAAAAAADSPAVIGSSVNTRGGVAW